MDWSNFLRQLAGSGQRVPAFVARNFILDEGVSEARSSSYAHSGGAAPHASYGAWIKAHRAYLEAKVFRQHFGAGLPLTLDRGDEDRCPETFRGSQYLEYDLQLDLIRVEELRGFAQVAGLPEQEVRRAADQWLQHGGPQAKQGWEDVLAQWARNAEIRPTFAALYEDVEAVLGGSSGWEDRLRDALGLAHCDPAQRGRPIEILVFRYPVSVVPKLRGFNHARRPLAVPTVLEGRFSAAFCPAPQGNASGYVVDLSGSATPVRREVVHPPVPFRAEHLSKFGTVRAGVNPLLLGTARGLHLVAVREIAGRAEYASDTDRDLLL